MIQKLEPLFHSKNLSEVLLQNFESARKSVANISTEVFLGASDDDLVSHVFSTVQLCPLELQEEDRTLSHSETERDVRRDPNYTVFDRSRPQLAPALEIRIKIPFLGNPTLWLCKPGSYPVYPPKAVIHSAEGDTSGVLEVVILTDPALMDEQSIAGEIESTLNVIRSHANIIKNNVQSHNNTLNNKIGEYVSERRKRLAKHENVVKLLNIPLARNVDVIAPIPLEKRVVRPVGSIPNLPDERGIARDEFEFILEIIRHVGRAFEGAPNTFAKNSEEELRDFVLAVLNIYYKGGATGEAFRRTGKTDICIVDSNRAAFVAECKLWTGKKAVSPALEQLLGYLTWRDCKAALVLFNKTVSHFTSILQQLPEQIESHPFFEASLECDQSGEWRYQLHAKEDEEHKIELHVFLFNVKPTKSITGHSLP